MVATQIQNENDISLFSGGNLTVVANHGTRRSSMIQMGNTVELKTFIRLSKESGYIFSTVDKYETDNFWEAFSIHKIVELSCIWKVNKPWQL